MKNIIVSILVLVLMTSFIYAQPVYEKINETSFKEVTTETKTSEETYTLKDLLQQKANLLEQIQHQKEELNRAIQEAEKKLAEIEALILKAKELGIVEY